MCDKFYRPSNSSNKLSDKLAMKLTVKIAVTSSIYTSEGWLHLYEMRSGLQIHSKLGRTSFEKSVRGHYMSQQWRHSQIFLWFWEELHNKKRSVVTNLQQINEACVNMFNKTTAITSDSLWWRILTTRKTRLYWWSRREPWTAHIFTCLCLNLWIANSYDPAWDPFSRALVMVPAREQRWPGFCCPGPPAVDLRQTISVSLLKRHFYLMASS